MLRTLTVKDPQTIAIRLSVQDKQRGFDWIDLVLQMQSVHDAALVDEEKLPLLDTDDGITLCYEKGLWGAGIGRFRSLEALRSSKLFLVGESLKYEEAPFSG